MENANVNEFMEMFGTHDQISTLKNVIADIMSISDTLKVEKFRREFNRNIEPEDDEVPYYLKMAVDELESAIADIKSAIENLTWEDMSLAERQEYFRHCYERHFA